jgi:DNA-binding FrmR family transcriptional regulator
MGYDTATPSHFPFCYTFYMKKNNEIEYKTLIDRLSRAEGQVRALRLALESGDLKDCKAFMSQIKAARSALKRTSEQYVLKHIHTCQALPKKEREKQIEEALKVLASD